MENWIKAKDRLPTRTGSYIVYTGKGLAFIARYDAETRRFNGRASLRITHWQHLPQPPKEVS